MMSQSTRTQRVRNRAGFERILDATREAVILHGVRRTTVQDVADRAGISRMTFYRQFGSIDHAVLQALTREFSRTIELVKEQTAGGPARQRLVNFLVQGVRLYREDQLISSIMERDPELLIPYVTDRFGASQELLLGAIEALLDEGRADGSITARPITGTMLLVIMQGVALPARILDLRDDFDAVLTELTDLLEGYLAPGEGR